MKQGTGRGRPRDAEIDRKILDAARVLLAEGGYRALAFDSISQMTEIPRSMIYRRWPTKAHLANEISTGGDDGLPDVIDAEGLDAQVLALVHQVFDRYRRPDIAAAAIGVIAATQGDRTVQDELGAKAEKNQASQDFPPPVYPAHFPAILLPAGSRAPVVFPASRPHNALF